MKYHVLYNPLAGNGRCEGRLEQLIAALEGECILHRMTEIGSYAEFLSKVGAEDKLILVGGDGTLNRFINDLGDIELKNEVLYYAAGSGNDFLKDVKGEDGDEAFSITKYIKNLPSVTVNGKTFRFLNGVGYGIDGYCCEVGDKIRECSDKQVNYTAIAIKGLLFGFKRPNARVTVDGKTFEYKKVWLAPTMNGRYYGGGMNMAPKQNRLNPDGTLSCVVLYGAGKLKTLTVFPSIFKGEHLSHNEMVTVHTGREITVAFDRPTALQIDGETILGVTEYTARAGVTAALPMAD